FACCNLMCGFSSSEITQEFTSFSVGRAAGCRDVEISGLALHVRRFLTDAIKTKVLDQPDWPARIEVCHMLATKRHDELTETILIGFDQPPPVLIFFRCHAIKYGGCCRVFGAKLGGIGSIDPPVLLF